MNITLRGSEVLVGSIPSVCSEDQGPCSVTGIVTIDELKTMVSGLTPKSRAVLYTGAREYQRERVASLEWNQAIIKTILCNPYARIPQIHIRIMERKFDGSAPVATYQCELVDGQQRTTAVLSFINNEYSLPTKFNVDHKGSTYKLGGMFYKDIVMQYPQIAQIILDYQITCVWYFNLTDYQTADLFVNVLNNNSDMNHQEIRNAMRGLFTRYVRNVTRMGAEDSDRLRVGENNYEVHPLFRTATDAKGKVYLPLLPKLTSKGRMEFDSWVTHLLYLVTRPRGAGDADLIRRGLNEAAVTAWVEGMSGESSPMNDVRNFAATRKGAESLLNEAKLLLEQVSDHDRKKNLSPMVAMIIVAFKDRLQNVSIDRKKFVDRFFHTYEKYSEEATKLYLTYTKVDGTPFRQPDGKEMRAFKEYFGGKGSNAMGTIFDFLNDRVAAEPEEWGITELDPRQTFSSTEITHKWEDQGRKCYYTGEPIELDDCVGDHMIPRSWGVKAGGTTTYDNLAVTTSYHNGRKLNMSADEYINMLKAV